MFAGVTSPSRATCPNTEMRRLDRRCCATGDRNLNCTVSTAGNVADDDTNKYIYYTLYRTHSFLLILLDLTLSALSLLSFSVSLAAFSRFP